MYDIEIACLIREVCELFFLTDHFPDERFVRGCVSFSNCSYYNTSELDQDCKKQKLIIDP